MSLIAMAVHDTEENGRTEYTKKTIDSLLQTVDFSKHRLLISDNGSCDNTQYLYRTYRDAPFHVIKNGENIGTAAAINEVWKFRDPGEHAIKIDNDVVIYQKGWADDMEEVLRRGNKIGQVGLKRKDCWEWPGHEDPFYKSVLLMTKHVPGERWIVVEKVEHVMGTCVMHSAALLDKVGYLYQPKLYGFDDALMSLRSTLAGFTNVFIPYINIDHIDTGATQYQKWKEYQASEVWNEYHKIVEEYKNNSKPLYYNPFI